MTMFAAIVMRDLRLAWRQGGWLAQSAGFYLLALTLFPLALGPDGPQLRLLAPGLLWIAFLLSGLLSLDRLFQADHDDGALDHLMLLPLGAPLMALAKAFAHWLLTGLPLVIVSPIFAFMYGLDAGDLPILLASFALGGAAFTLIGGFGAALALMARRGGGTLTALLVLPFYLPILILGVGATEAALMNLSPWPSLMAMGGLAGMALALAPWGMAAALRLALE